MSWQEKAKRVDWGTVGKTLATAFVVASRCGIICDRRSYSSGRSRNINSEVCGSRCGSRTSRACNKRLCQTVKGVYETYKRMEATNWDIEEGLVVLSEHIGSAAGALAGGAIGNKIGGMLSDKIYAKSSIYQKMKNGTICFIAGTLVSTRLGRKRIEKIEKGDEVYSYDELTGQKVLRKVRDVHEHITDTFVRIKTKTEEILTTLEHPFYVKGRYILAGFLSAGMSLTGFAGEQIEIQETEVIRYEIPQKVYNFSIEGTENYYVGEQGVLVHNVEGCPPGNEARKKNTETKKKMDEIEVKFNCKEDHDPAKLSEQLSVQEDEMNKLSVEKYKANRDKFIKDGKPPEAKKVQRLARKEEIAKRTKELTNKGIPYKEAKTQATQSLKGQAALHGPDMIAGGDLNNITGFGDAKINSSIGSQWPSRIEPVDKAVDNYIKANNIPKSEWGNIYLNIKLKQ